MKGEGEGEGGEGREGEGIVTNTCIRGSSILVSCKRVASFPHLLRRRRRRRPGDEARVRTTLSIKV